jgi:hypothetical protein
MGLFQEANMIRLTSIQQALSLRGTIPELAIIRAIQFMGDGYIPEEDGSIGDRFLFSGPRIRLRGRSGLL